MKLDNEKNIIHIRDRSIPPDESLERVILEAETLVSALGLRYDRPSKTCYHRKKTMNDEARMVQCDDCGAYLDPYDCLERAVKQIQRTIEDRRILNQESRTLSKKIKSQKKELKRLDDKIFRRGVNLKKINSSIDPG